MKASGCRVMAAVALFLLSGSLFADWYDDSANLDVSSLPSAYIESDGTSYLDTGYIPTTNTSVACDFAYMDVTAQQFIFEGGDSVTATNGGFRAYFREYVNGGGNHAWAMNRKLWVNPGLGSVQEGHRVSVFMDAPGMRVIIKNVNAYRATELESWTKSQSDASSTLKLFSDSTGNYNRSKARIYQLKIFESGELVRDFTPATKNGHIGLYDSVTGDFIGDTSGISFGGVTALPEIPDDPYIESDGTAGITTGVQAQPGLRVEVDYQITGDPIIPQWRIVATDGDDTHPRLSAYVNASTNIALTIGDKWNSPNSTELKADFARHLVTLGGANNKNTYHAFGRKALKTLNGQTITKNSLVQITLLATGQKWFGGTFITKAKAKIYGAKFWVGRKLIRDFRPRTVNGVAGLEDVVNGGFYTGAGYTASANTPEGLTATPGYIENDGSFFSYVNTFYYPNQKSKIEVDYQLVKLEASKIICGAYGAGAGLTALMWHDSSGKVRPQVKDGDYGTPSMSPEIYMDSALHTALIDVPARRTALLDENGAVMTQSTAPESSNASLWPMLLFGGAKDVYGHAYTGQMSTCRIFGARVWEKEDEEYVLKHDFRPVVNLGIAGFRDAVTGKFFSGDHLTAGGAVESISEDDPYIENPTGGRFIDTGYSVTKDTSVWMDFMPLLQRGTQQFPYEAGAEKQAPKMYIRAYGNGGAGQGDYSHAFGIDTFKSTLVPYQPNVRVQLFHDAVNGRFSVLREGVELGGTNFASSVTSGITEASSGTLKLLCSNGMNSNSARARLYGVKIYEKGVLVRDYVPVVNGTSGALFDKVQGQILLKAEKSTEFVVNPAMTANNAWFSSEMRDEDAYILSDGSQVIDTGYKATPTSRFEIDFQFTAIRGQNRMFGSVTGTSIAEMYVQGENTGSGNVAFLVGDKQTGQYTSMGSDLNRHRGILDIYSHSVGYTGWGYKAAPNAFAMTRTTGTIGLFVKNTSDNGFSGWQEKNVSKMKLYAFRIYEENQLVHQYLPYKNGGVIGLYDTVTGEVLTKLFSNYGTLSEFTYGGEGYGGYWGSRVRWLSFPRAQGSDRKARLSRRMHRVRSLTSGR